MRGELAKYEFLNDSKRKCQQEREEGLFLKDKVVKCPLKGADRLHVSGLAEFIRGLLRRPLLRHMRLKTVFNENDECKR